jgi:hypothetical protein
MRVAPSPALTRGTYRALTSAPVDAAACSTSSRRDPKEVVAYLKRLPALWADSGAAGRHAPATALFAKVEVEGYRRMEFELTPDAIGLGG